MIKLIVEYTQISISGIENRAGIVEFKQLSSVSNRAIKDKLMEQGRSFFTIISIKQLEDEK